MEYGRAVKFPFAGEGWVAKVVIGVVLGLIPIANLAAYGYGVEVIRRVASGSREELPRWDDFGRYFVRGFAVTVASLLYILPGVLVFLLLLAGGSSSGALMALAVLLFFAYLLAVGLLFPAALVRYALTDQWYTMFDFGWLVGFISRETGSYVALLLATMLFALLLGVVAVITFGLAAVFTNFWTLLVATHLLGQLARRVGPLRAGLAH